jgi:hypothetical protein
MPLIKITQNAQDRVTSPTSLNNKLNESFNLAAKGSGVVYFDDTDWRHCTPLHTSVLSSPKTHNCQRTSLPIYAWLIVTWTVLLIVFHISHKSQMSRSKNERQHIFNLASKLLLDYKTTRCNWGHFITLQKRFKHLFWPHRTNWREKIIQCTTFSKLKPKCVHVYRSLRSSKKCRRWTLFKYIC